MKKIFILLFVIIAGFLLYMLLKPSGNAYDLQHPDKTLKLPKGLKEISGITPLDDDHIACVQDEEGSIYVYSLAEEHLEHEFKKDIAGDFEGITLVGTNMYILRSDGILLEYPDYTSDDTTKFIKYDLKLPTVDNEGLCYDKMNNRLLIAAKSKTDDGEEKKSIRLIYGFDLKTKTCAANPVFRINVKLVEDLAFEKKIIDDIPKKHRSDPFNFKPSEIAIDPIDTAVYILSGQDKLLLITDKTGDIKDLISLDENLFRQAEGMTFLTNGDLLISNEANKGKPTLLLFKNKKR